MTLDSFSSDSINSLKAAEEHVSQSSFSLLKDSALFQLNQAEVGVAQTVGLDQYVTHMAQPAEAETTFGRHVQMLGAAIVGLAPIAVMAAASKFAVGRVASRFDAPLDNAVFRQSAIGFNVAESATTGLLSGAVLRPSDENAMRDWKSFALDRATSGLSSAASFSLMAASSFGVKAVSESQLVTKVGLGSVLGNSVVAGALAGVPGGIANVEMDSLFKHGTFTSDLKTLESSVYQMSLTGGVFGLTHEAVSRFAKAGLQESGDSVKSVRGVPTQTQAEVEENPGQSTVEFDKKSEGRNEKDYAVERLSDLYGSDSPTMQRLLELDHKRAITVKILSFNDDEAARLENKSYLPGLAKFIALNVDEHKPLVERIAVDAKLSNAIAPERINALADLNKRFGENSSVIETLLRHEEQSNLDLTIPLKWIDQNGATAESFLTRLTAQGAKAKNFNENELQALSRFDSAMNHNDEYLRTVIHQETSAIRLEDLAKFVEEDEQAPRRQNVIGKEISEGRYVEHVSAPGFRLLERLNGALDDPNNDYVETLITSSFKDKHLDAVEKIVAELGHGAKEIVQKIANESTDLSQLNMPTIKNLDRLNALLQPDSDITRTLLRFDSFGSNALPALIEFIEKSPEVNKSLINTLSGSWAGAHEIGKALVSADLQERFADNSRLGNDPNLLSMDVHQWLESKDDKTFFSMLDRLSNNDNLPLPRVMFIKALSDIERLIGLDAHSLRKLRGFEQTGLSPYDLAEIAKLADSPEGKNTLVDLLATSTNPSELRAHRVESLIQLHKAFSPGSEAIEKLLELERKGLDLTTVSALIRKDPTRNTELIREALQNKPELQNLSGSEFIARSSVLKRFEQEPEVVKKLLQFEKNGLKFDSLESYIAADPAKGMSVVSGLVHDGAGGELLSGSRLKTLDIIETTFGADTEIMRKIIERENAGFDISNIGQLFDRAVSESYLPGALDLVTRLLRENAPDSQLWAHELDARITLPKLLGEHSDSGPRMQHLLDVGASLTGIKYFVDDGSETADMSVVLKLLDQKANVEQLNPERMAALVKLTERFGEDSDKLQRLLSMESPRFTLADVSKFLQEDPNNESILATVLDSPDISRNFSSKALLDKTNLPHVAQNFHPSSHDALQRIEEYQKQGSLSALRLSRYLAASPESRTPIIQRLLNEDASAARLNAQMSLSVLPDELAYQLSKDDEGARQRIGKVRNGLRMWNGGRQFADLLVEQFERSGDLSPAAIDKLILAARESAAPSLRNANSAVLSSSHPSDGAEQSPHPLRSADSSTDSADSGASRLSVNEKAIAEAKTLEDAAREIRSLIPADRPIVLLGRDSWPLLPALRDGVRDIQYFLWTRLQIGDPATEARWLKEVPPYAAVIDTGFKGSVIDAIRKIDPSASGYLLSSVGRYPQLLRTPGFTVGRLEAYPKMIGRSSSYTTEGGAISKQSARDESDNSSYSSAARLLGPHRWVVEEQTDQLLKDVGVSSWDRWRFKDYVGLIPKERLFLDSDADVRRHYEDVEKRRLAAQFNT